MDKQDEKRMKDVNDKSTHKKCSICQINTVFENSELCESCMDKQADNEP